jgi:predicted 2-oxoglutarate/Fe(II)-dependent dioxygenase YbiX
MKFTYYCFQNLYSKEELLLLNEKLNNFSEKNFNDKPAENVKKTSQVTFHRFLNFWKELEKFKDCSFHANKESFGFDLYNITKFDIFHFNVYDSEKQGEYDWHSDGILEQCSDIKLTAILNVSDEPYEGGEFSLFLGEDLKIKEINKLGNLLIFPSFIQHKVNPVTKGKRKTICCFLYGPNWK